MKNVNDLMMLLNKVVQNNSETSTWFFNYSGHVNLIEVRYYPNGWKSFDELDELGEKPKYFVMGAYSDNQESLTELYYWVKWQMEGKI